MSCQSSRYLRYAKGYVDHWGNQGSKALHEGVINRHIILRCQRCSTQPCTSHYCHGWAPWCPGVLGPAWCLSGLRLHLLAAWRCEYCGPQQSLLLVVFDTPEMDAICRPVQAHNRATGTRVCPVSAPVSVYPRVSDGAREEQRISRLVTARDTA